MLVQEVLRVPQKRAAAREERLTPPDEPLAVLIRRLQDGDDRALEPFIRCTQGMAFRLARSLLRDDDQCQDVLQDVYLAVHRDIRGLRDVGAFRTWFGRIVVNRCKRLMRRARPESLDVLLEKERGPSVSGGEAQVEQRADLRRALAGMSVADRTVLMLREVMQLSYDEIAATLSIPLGTVRSRLSEARRRLIDAWNDPHTPKTTTGKAVKALLLLSSFLFMRKART